MISALDTAQPTAETNKVGSEMLQKPAGEDIVIAGIFCPHHWIGGMDTV
jgi:hypothetical protein